MTYVISNACIDVKDMSCIEVCPVDCIYQEDEDRMVYIEPDQCIDCGVCVSACPTGSLSLVRDPQQGIPLELDRLMQAAAARG